MAYSCAREIDGHTACETHCGSAHTCLVVGPRVRASALARLLSVSRQSVHELIERGIVARGDDGLIDVALARLAIANNVRPSSKTSQALDAVPAPSPAPAAAPSPAPSTGDTYHNAKRRREAAEASIAELRHAELRGLLVRVDKVRAEQSRLAASMREAFLQLPARLSLVIAAETDAAKVHDLLDAELRHVLAMLADQLETRAAVAHTTEGNTR